MKTQLMTTRLQKVLVYVWVSPTTLFGLLFVPIAFLSGGRIQLVGGVIEVSGGLVRRFLKSRLFVLGEVAAITLGHVVLGQDYGSLVASREHERMHVRQYELWGPLMVPVYLFSSCLATVRGRHPYWDNWFERAAYRIAQ